MARRRKGVSVALEWRGAGNEGGDNVVCMNGLSCSVIARNVRASFKKVGSSVSKFACRDSSSNCTSWVSVRGKERAI